MEAQTKRTFDQIIEIIDKNAGRFVILNGSIMINCTDTQTSILENVPSRWYPSEREWTIRNYTIEDAATRLGYISKISII